MPGYPIVGANEGSGLLPWSWALDRLTNARHYWVCSVDSAGAPHVSPVWGVWHDERLWFSCSPGSRKARNLTTEPRCAVATDDPEQPATVRGVAQRVGDRDTNEAVRVAMAAKYDYEMSLDFLLANALFAVSPATVIGMVESDFTGSPTRWDLRPQ
jgi:hypothetical protein